jgi:hypothetical protein
MARRVLVGCVLGMVALASAGCMQTFSTAQSPFVAGSLNQGLYGSGLVFVHDLYTAGTHAHQTNNNFFTFDLASSCTAGKVTLALARGDDESTGTYTLQDVTSPADVVNNPAGDTGEDFVTNWTNVMEDLGGGVSYGEFAISPSSSSPETVELPLNGDGVAAFNAAHGTFFTIGGHANSIHPDPFFPDWLFQDTTTPARLIVSCVIPSSAADCADGRWRAYPGFASEADCIEYATSRS